VTETGYLELPSGSGLFSEPDSNIEEHFQILKYEKNMKNVK
jgi:hypothetical protein